MDDLKQAVELLNVPEKWLQPFEVVDPFSGLELSGFLSLKPDSRYGALALLEVAGRPVPQQILATPKLHYPFNKKGEFNFPAIHHIDIYEKLDGTNVLAYRFMDANGEWHTTYKLRLYPVLRNGRWGNFLDMWKEVLERYPSISELPEINQCSLSFELYGSRNPHLIAYKIPLDCALLFGIDPLGNCTPPSGLDASGIPTPRNFGNLSPHNNPVEEYQRIREQLEKEVQTLEGGTLSGSEGTVWYVTTASDEVILFKCKPESVEAIHWKGGISKEAVIATCWNLLETEDEIQYPSLERLLLEEYLQDDIDRFREHIDRCIVGVMADLDFRKRVLDAYKATGVKISDDKAAVMRALSHQFPRGDMKRVYHEIVTFGNDQ